MPRNGSGVYSPPGASFPAVSGTLIEAAEYNDVVNDAATAISASIASDGQSVITANINLSGFKLTGVGAATARTDAATLASIQDGTGTYVATVGGTADAITLTPSPAITAYAAGQRFSFIASGANTGAVTVNASAVGVKSVTKNGSIALVANDIPSGQLIVIEYDGTRFQIQTANIGTAASKNTGTSGNTVPLLDGANTWSAPQTIQSTDAGAAEGPVLTLDRDSASPTGSDLLGVVQYLGNDSGGGDQEYAATLAKIIDPTAASEDGEYIVRTVKAGTIANRLHVGAGAYMSGATGGDQGADSINAKAYYKDGVAVRNWKVIANTGQITSGATKDVAGIGATSEMVDIIFRQISLTGTDSPLIQLGHGGGPTFIATNYDGVTRTRFDSGVNHSTSILLANGAAAANRYHGKLSLTKADGNIWNYIGQIAEEADPNDTFQITGWVDVTAALTAIRLGAGAGSIDDGYMTVRSYE